MNYMKKWIAIKLLWDIGMALAAVLSVIITTNKWELKETFYLIGIMFVIWFMIDELIQMFMPVMIPTPPRRSNNGQ